MRWPLPAIVAVLVISAALVSAQPRKPSSGTSSSGSSGWDGGNTQIAFGQGGNLTGTPALTWDGGTNNLIFGATGDGGIILPPGGTIWFVPPGGNGDGQILYFDTATATMLLRTNELDIGHGTTGGGGILTLDGDANIDAAEDPRILLSSSNSANLYNFQVLGTSPAALSILPLGTEAAGGQVIIGPKNSGDGKTYLVVDGGVLASKAYTSNAPAGGTAFQTNNYGARMCLDPGCVNFIWPDAGSVGNSNNKNVGMYLHSQIQADNSSNVGFVLDASNKDGSALATADLLEVWSAGGKIMSFGPAGQVTFSGVLLSGGLVGAHVVQDNTLNELFLEGNPGDNSGHVGVSISAATTLTAADTRIVSFENPTSTVKSQIDKTGLFIPPVIPTASLPTCDATHLMGAIAWDSTSTSVKVCKGGGGWTAL